MREFLTFGMSIVSAGKDYAPRVMLLFAPLIIYIFFLFLGGNWIETSFHSFILLQL